MEGTRWFVDRYEWTLEEYMEFCEFCPGLATSQAIGYMDPLDNLRIIFLLDRFPREELDIIKMVVDGWLHEFVEVLYVPDISLYEGWHESYEQLITRITEYVLAF